MGDYHAGPVCLDEMVTVFGQYDPENRWNGWLNPYIDAWSVELTLTRLNESYGDDADTYGYDWTWDDEGALVLTSRQLLEEAQNDEQRGHATEVIAPNDDGLYGLGYYGWTWSEDHNYGATEEWQAWHSAYRDVYIAAANAENHRRIAAGEPYDPTARGRQDSAAHETAMEWSKNHPEPVKYPNDADTWVGVPGQSLIWLRVRIDNVYPDGTVRKTMWLLVPPPPAGYDEDTLNEWAEDELYEFTGTGRTEGDAGYFLTILQCESDPALVDTEFEWGI